METLNKAILWYAITYQGDWQKIGEAIKNKEPFQYIQVPCCYITIVDKEYPDLLKALRYPPWILFYKGNIQLLKHTYIGIVGSRKCSQQAIKNTEIVVNRIKKKYGIVSGLARGIDGMAHHCALDAKTIGILGCGIDQVYPKENKHLFYAMEKKQLILSEYPPGTPPLRHHFPWRNRLIAAFSQALIVIEANHKSGTMITVNDCLELSKPVYCLPTSFNQKEYQGCNYLIQNGANLVMDEKDLDDI